MSLTVEQIEAGQAELYRCTQNNGIICDMEQGAADWLRKHAIDLVDTALTWRREADAALAKLASLRRPSVMRPPMELPEDDEAESDRRALVEAAVRAGYEVGRRDGINLETVDDVVDRVLAAADSAREPEGT